MSPRTAAVCVTVASLVFAGCVFHDAPPPRYFAPPSEIASAADSPPTRTASAIPVRLDPARPANYLGEQIAWRVSDVERGLYEGRRWTELPSRYVDRAMAQALDHTPGIRRVESGPAATLDLDLTAFDEVLAPTHAAGVEIVASLRGPDRNVIFERAFRTQRPVADAEPSAVARAMGQALDDVVMQIAAQVAAEAPPARATTRR